MSPRCPPIFGLSGTPTARASAIDPSPILFGGPMSATIAKASLFVCRFQTAAKSPRCAWPARRTRVGSAMKGILEGST
jgi:hypothetical protein